MLTTMQVGLIRKKSFVVIAFDLDNETFVVHIVSIDSLNPMHLTYQAQIASLKGDKAP